MASRQLVFDILANNKTGPGVKGAETDIQKLERQWGQFKQAAVVASTAVVAGLAVMGKKAVDAASDLGESTNAVRVTFGDAADGILELGENAAEAVGLSNAQFNGLAVQFSSFANTVAGEGGDVVAVMGDLTGRAADFASVMNIDVAEAARTFQSGLAGETEPLKKYGIDLSAAAVENYALANGIATAGEKMTEQQKIQARYGLLMEQTSKTAGDFQNTQDGMANASRVLSAQWTDLQAELGEKLLPYMEKAIGVGRDMVAWMGENEGVVVALVAAVGGLAATILAVTVAQRAWTAAQVIWTGVTTIATTVQKGLNLAMKANPILLIVSLIAILVLAVVKAYQENEKFREVVDKALVGVYTAWQWLWNNGIAPVIRFILNGFANIVQGIANMLRALGNIPGFGWAKDAADKMDNAASKARAMAKGINDIPDRKRVTVTFDGYPTPQFQSLQRASTGSALSSVVMASGGYVTGPGTGTSDSIPARLSNGEYVLNAAAVSRYGVGFLDDLNARRFAAGGYVGSAAASAESGPVDLSDRTIDRLATAMLAGAGAVAGGAMTRERLAMSLAGRPVD